MERLLSVSILIVQMCFKLFIPFSKIRRDKVTRNKYLQVISTIEKLTHGDPERAHARPRVEVAIKGN